MLVSANFSFNAEKAKMWRHRPKLHCERCDGVDRKIRVFDPYGLPGHEGFDGRGQSGTAMTRPVFGADGVVGRSSADHGRDSECHCDLLIVTARPRRGRHSLAFEESVRPGGLSHIQNPPARRWARYTDPHWALAMPLDRN